MNDPQDWREGDTWTNERGVTFRLELDQASGRAALVWVKQHYKLPQITQLNLQPCR